MKTTHSSKLLCFILSYIKLLSIITDSFIIISFHKHTITMKKILLSAAILIFSLSANAQSQSQSPWLRMGQPAPLSSPSDFMGYGFTNSPDLIFKTSATERMSITSGGKIIIGPPIIPPIIPPLPIIPGGPPVVEVRGNTSIFGNLATNGVLAANDVITNTLNVKSNGEIYTLRIPTLSGSGDRQMVVDGNGNLKIGNPVPLYFCGSPWCTNGNGVVQGNFTPGQFFGTLDANDLVIKTNNNEVMRVTANGKVQIGLLTQTVPPHNDYLLSVDGKIVARKVVTTALNWADDELVNPATTDELEKEQEFVYKNGHLQKVPSEKEVLENGIEMSEMFPIQMRKIEQLFKYSFLFKDDISELKQENKILKDENKQIKKNYDELKQRIEALEKNKH